MHFTKRKEPEYVTTRGSVKLLPSELRCAPIYERTGRTPIGYLLP